MLGFCVRNLGGTTRAQFHGCAVGSWTSGRLKLSRAGGGRTESPWINPGKNGAEI